MIKWTTPTLVCSVPEGIEFDYILLTLKQGQVAIEKRIDPDAVTDNEFSVFFTQYETSQFNLVNVVEAQLNIMHGETRLATNIIELKIARNLHDELIGVAP